MSNVTLRQNENLESAIKRFKRKVEMDGIIKEYKENQYFEKPSDKKRRKRKDSIRKLKIKQSQKDNYSRSKNRGR